MPALKPFKPRLPRLVSRLVSLSFALVLLAAGGLGMAATSAAPGNPFDQANKLYEEGKYSDAAKAYEQMIQSGQASAAVYFNLGNALFKAGQLGRAIVNYRRAEQLSPRDPDLRANLQFARATANGGNITPGNWWQRWILTFTLNEWVIATAISLWWLFGLLAACQWKPAWKTALRNHLILAAALTLFLGLALMSGWGYRYQTTSAVVSIPEAVVRYGPLNESKSFYTVRDGVELTVLGNKDGWLQVEDGKQRVGWVKQEQVILLKPNG